MSARDWIHSDVATRLVWMNGKSYSQVEFMIRRIQSRNKVGQAFADILNLGRSKAQRERREAAKAFLKPYWDEHVRDRTE